MVNHATLKMDRMTLRLHKLAFATIANSPMTTPTMRVTALGFLDAYDQLEQTVSMDAVDMVEATLDQAGRAHITTGTFKEHPEPKETKNENP